MPEYTVSPYIPLSWLRDTWKHVRQLYLNRIAITHHDVWLWMVRNEISRLVIWELQKENYELKQRIASSETERLREMEETR